MTTTQSIQAQIVAVQLARMALQREIAKLEQLIQDSRDRARQRGLR